MLVARWTFRRQSARLVVLVLVGLLSWTLIKWAPSATLLQRSTADFGFSLLLAGPLDFTVHYFGSVLPALLLGLFLAASIETLIPPAWLAHVLGRGNRSAMVGGAVSIPAMLCSCCAAPAAVGLRRAGAAMGAALAFWIGNPMLNPAVLAFLTIALDWRYAALRGLAACVLVFVACPIVAATAGATTAQLLPAAPTTPPRRSWIATVTRYARALVPEYVVLVLAVGLLRTWLIPAVPSGLGNDIAAMGLAAIAGALFVVPTAGEIPIVQALRELGLGAGPAAVLIVTLPALSLPSIGMLWTTFPHRVLIAMTAITVVVGLLAGSVAILLAFP